MRSLPGSATNVVLGCSICESGTKNLVCPGCVNNTLLCERRKLLAELCGKRDLLLEKLNVLLEQRELHQQQQYQRQQKAVNARSSKRHAALVQQELQSAKEEVLRLRQANASRRSRLERMSQQLAGSRTEQLVHAFPTLLRYQSLTLSHVSAMLAAQQRMKLQQLLDILPLRISGIRSHSSNSSGSASAGGGGSSSASSSIQVTVAGLKVPDAATVLPLMLQQPEATSSSLGYLVLLLDLAATYVGGPLLHEGSFQASTSVLWQQASFWNRRPASPNARLPLFLEEGSGAGGSLAMANPFPSLMTKRSRSTTTAAASASSSASNSSQQQRASSERVTSGTSSSGAAGVVGQQWQDGQYTFTQTGPRSVDVALTADGMSPSDAAERMGGGGGAGPGPGSTAASLGAGSASGGGGGGGGGGVSSGGGSASHEALALRQRHADLRAAFDMLQRSASCLVQDKVGGLQLTLPGSWSPFGWLVLLMAETLKDANSAGILAAAASSSGSGAGPGGGGGMAWQGGDGNMLLAPDFGDGEFEEEDADGWGVVRAPYLPPPPSADEDVEHWSRAMFTDAAAAGRSHNSSHHSSSHHHQQQSQHHQQQQQAGAGVGSLSSLRALFGR